MGGKTNPRIWAYASSLRFRGIEVLLEEVAKYKAMGSEDASLSEMESAYSSSAFMSKILLEKRRHARELEHKAREARRGKDEGKPDEKPGEGPS